MVFNLFYGMLISAAVSGFLLSLFGSVYLTRRYRRWRGSELVLLRALAIISTLSTIALGTRVIRIMLEGAEDTLRVPPFDAEFYFTILVYLLTIIALCLPSTVGYFAVHKLREGSMK